MKTRRLVIATLFLLLLFSYFPLWYQNPRSVIHFLLADIYFWPIRNVIALILHVTIPICLGSVAGGIYDRHKGWGRIVLLFNCFLAFELALDAWRSNFPRDWWMLVMMFDHTLDTKPVQLLVACIWVMLVLIGFYGFLKWKKHRRAVP